jgi:Ni,Fe-hydrogenase III component G
MTKKHNNTELLTSRNSPHHNDRKSSKPLSQSIKNRRSEIKIEAKKLTQDTFFNKQFKHYIRITNKGIKEWINQPHVNYAEKNETLLNIKSIIHNAAFLGKMSRKPDDDYSSYLFLTKIKNIKSWIIVRKYDRLDNYVIHSISDSYGIIRHLLKEEKDAD